MDKKTILAQIKANDGLIIEAYGDFMRVEERIAELKRSNAVQQVLLEQLLGKEEAERLVKSPYDEWNL